MRSKRAYLWAMHYVKSYMFSLNSGVILIEIPVCSQRDIRPYFTIPPPGIQLGRLRVPNQPHSNPRVCSHDYWPVFSPYLCGVLHHLLSGYHPLHADTLRRLCSCRDVRTHGSFGSVWLVPDCGICAVPSSEHVTHCV